MRVLALIDDPVVRNGLKDIVNKKTYENIRVDYKFSYYERYEESETFKPINIKESCKDIIKNYDIVFSLCSQIFPKELVNNVRCINFHFGILPYVCGVFPIAFSIVNDMPSGVTIHLMDEQIDHGDIIYQEEVNVSPLDKYKDIERKCQKKLIDILKKHINDLIYGNYKTRKQLGKRKYFSIKDFNNLCKIDLKEKLTLKELLDRLRALELSPIGNAFYISDNGEKINISVNLIKK